MPSFSSAFSVVSVWTTGENASKLSMRFHGKSISVVGALVFESKKRNISITPADVYNVLNSGIPLLLIMFVYLICITA